MKTTVIGAMGTLLLLFFSVTFAQATLWDRGGGLIYDDVFDITWVQDANLAQTSGYDEDGLMTALEAITWAETLVYRGYDDWRLPDPFGLDGSQPQGGWYQDINEMGYMYYETLGNEATLDGRDLSGLTETGPFINLQPYRYHTGTNWYSYTDFWWYFNFGNGYEFDASTNVQNYAWAVRDGDSAPVPVPATIWFLMTGILGIRWTRLN